MGPLTDGRDARQDKHFTSDSHVPHCGIYPASLSRARSVPKVGLTKPVFFRYGPGWSVLSYDSRQFLHTFALRVIDLGVTAGPFALTSIENYAILRSTIWTCPWTCPDVILSG